MVIAKGLTHKERAVISRNEKTLKFNFIYPLECVQADDMHACLVPDDTGKRKKAILIAFIDDATRRIVYANFSFTERSLEFEKGILHILKAHGRIVRLYVDNGSTFVSQQTQRIMDIMGIIISHSRPAIPRGRGKNRAIPSFNEKYHPSWITTIGNMNRWVIFITPADKYAGRERQIFTLRRRIKQKTMRLRRKENGFKITS
jgi:transposase InsO family protein